MADWNGALVSPTAGSRANAAQMAALTAKATADISAWTTYTPTISNLTQGNGTVSAAYSRVGMWLDALFFGFTFGSSGSAVGTNPGFSLPPGLSLHASIAASGFFLAGPATLVDATGPVRRMGAVQVDSATALSFVQISNTPAVASITSSSPWTWAQGDMLMCLLTHLPLAS